MPSWAVIISYILISLCDSNFFYMYIGVNCVVEPTKMLNILGENIPTMIMGADVTHPPAGSQQGSISIAAVVGSMDSKFVFNLL
jgi:hypothetical protein